MKLHKLTVYIFDHDEYGPEEYRTLIEDHKHITSHVIIEGTADIGEWDDDHPLNKHSANQLTFEEYFK